MWEEFRETTEKDFGWPKVLSKCQTTLEMEARFSPVSAELGRPAAYTGWICSWAVEGAL